MQRDPGSSLHVIRDEALVVPPPASPTPSPIAQPSVPATRPPEGPATVRGKFFFVGDQKLYLRGVTYGTFRPRADGSEVPEPDAVDRDFAGMAAHGFNTVRVYTVPPRWLLDTAARHGLRSRASVERTDRCSPGSCWPAESSARSCC